MKRITIIEDINGEKVKMLAIKIENKDRRKLRLIFKLWIKLSKLLRNFSARGINIPEGLTESLFCLETGSVRVLKASSKGSFDTFDPVTKKRQQIKASSSAGSTSFGPRSFWDPDELYWLDFFRNKNVDGSYDIYRIPDIYVYGCNVNKEERLSDQQKQKRRPRMDFRKVIVEENKIPPIKEKCYV